MPFLKTIQRQVCGQIARLCSIFFFFTFCPQFFSGRLSNTPLVGLASVRSIGDADLLEVDVSVEVVGSLDGRVKSVDLTAHGGQILFERPIPRKPERVDQTLPRP